MATIHKLRKHILMFNLLTFNRDKLINNFTIWRQIVRVRERVKDKRKKGEKERIVEFWL